MANRIVHWEVIGKDGKKLQAFYSALFGWRIDANNPMNYGMVADTDAGVGGGIGASPDGQGHVTFYVEVEDLAKSLQQAEQLGGRTVMPPNTVPGGPTIALFADPEGHVIGLVQATTG